MAYELTPGVPPLRASRATPIMLAGFGFGLLTLLIAVIDRIGAPGRLVAALAPAVALGSFALAGILARTMQMSRFFGSGLALPAAHAGLASAAVLLAMALPCLAPLQASSAQANEATALLAALVGGMALATCTVWPLLRANSANSLADLLAARFELRSFRLAIAGASACICALVLFAGFKLALNMFAAVAGLPVVLTAALLALVLACIALPGGIVGTLRVALIVGALSLVSLACGALYVLLAGPAGIFGATLGLALPPVSLPGLTQSAAQQMAAVFAEKSQLWLVLPAALGLALLPPMTLGAIAVADGRASTRAGVGTLLWSLLLLAGVFAILSVAGQLLAAQLTDTARSLPGLFAQGATEGLSFCGRSAASLSAAQAACTGAAGFSGTLRPQDVEASGLYVLLAFPRLIAASPALRALAATLAGTLGIALAATGLQGLATALGHDALLHNAKGVLTSARLAMTRLVMVIALACTVTGALLLPLDPRAAIGLAVSLSLALLLAPVVLALLPRASGLHALLGLFAGVAGFVSAILGRGGQSDFGVFASAGIVGASLALLVGVGCSLVARASPANQAAARALRQGALPALLHREGA